LAAQTVVLTALDNDDVLDTISRARHRAQGHGRGTSHAVCAGMRRPKVAGARHCRARGGTVCQGQGGTRRMTGILTRARSSRADGRGWPEQGGREAAGDQRGHDQTICTASRKLKLDGRVALVQATR
jgi:uncharacterized Zn-binding protein involved in type VI secretion